MKNVSHYLTPLLLAVFTLSALTAHAVIREVAAGQSALPPATGANKKTAEEILSAVIKDKAAALTQFEAKPLRITGKVKHFNADYPLNIDQDLFIIVEPTKPLAQEGPAPYEIFVRFSRPQLKVFGLPADKKPPITDSRYKSLDRKVEQAHTVAYFNKDLNCIALYDSETVIVPVPPGAPQTAKPTPTPLTFDKIPLVSVGDAFDADVVFEQLDANNSLIFKATIDPAPPRPAPAAAK